MVICGAVHSKCVVFFLGEQQRVLWATESK